ICIILLLLLIAAFIYVLMDDYPACIIRWQVDKISTLRDPGRRSPAVYGKNMAWVAKATVEKSHRTNQVKHLACFLYCNQRSERTSWSCNATVEFVVINKDEKNNYTCSVG
ncbi:hypothetical protein PFISCL1PPCAC_21960, partial [Pristionchus fissidentatus]